MGKFINCLIWFSSMNSWQSLLDSAPTIEARLGYAFDDRELLALAFVHRSYVNENKDLVPEHNERLEFLGDSVLGLLISDYLYRYLPETPEGELSKLRSRLVEASSCMRYVQSLELDEFLLLGKGEQRNDGRGRESIQADLFESVIGAIFLDGGYDAAKSFLFRTFSREIDAILSNPDKNWKAILQDWAQKERGVTPSYEVLDTSGPDHSKTFTVAVVVGEQTVGEGTGSSKKEAQQQAARRAIEALSIDVEAK